MCDQHPVEEAEHEWHPEHPVGQSAMSATVTSGNKFVFSICLDGLLSATSVMSVIWGQSWTGALTEHPVHGWPHLLPPDWLNILRLSGKDQVMGNPLQVGRNVVICSCTRCLRVLFFCLKILVVGLFCF